MITFKEKKCMNPNDAKKEKAYTLKSTTDAIPGR
jgi:hypothetical protein